MEQKRFRRKLTAILSADVAGYSRLMQDDEAATVKTLEAYKQIISDLVQQHRGRVVDSPEDYLLAEFAGVADAVQCAVATQEELQTRNAELSENRKMQFRIGVNLGDVIEESGRLLHDIALPNPGRNGNGKALQPPRRSMISTMTVNWKSSSRLSIMACICLRFRDQYMNLITIADHPHEN
jgi:hypothetical protein